MNDLQLSLDVQAGLLWYYVLLAVDELRLRLLPVPRQEAALGRPSGASSPALALMHAFAYFLHGDCDPAQADPRGHRLP